MHQVDDAGRQMPGNPFHQGQRHGVALPGGIRDSSPVHGVDVAAAPVQNIAARSGAKPIARPARERSAGRQRFQAADISAVAERAVLVDGHVSDLAAEAVRAGVQPVVDDDSAADAGADSHIDHVAASPARAVCVLASRAECGVVTREHRQRQAL